MEYREYLNYKQIEELESKIKAIDPALGFSGFGLSGNKAISCSVMVKERGNRKKIKKLEELGFWRKYRKKVVEPKEGNVLEVGYGYISVLERNIDG